MDASLFNGITSINDRCAMRWVDSFCHPLFGSLVRRIKSAGRNFDFRELAIRE
jgi:hypothetical protein